MTNLESITMSYYQYDAIKKTIAKLENRIKFLEEINDLELHSKDKLRIQLEERLEKIRSNNYGSNFRVCFRLYKT